MERWREDKGSVTGKRDGGVGLFFFFLIEHPPCCGISPALPLPSLPLSP